MSALFPSMSANFQVDGDVLVGLVETNAAPPEASIATQKDAEAHEIPTIEEPPVICTGAAKTSGGDAALMAVAGTRTPTDAQSVATAAIKIHTRRAGRRTDAVDDRCRVRHPE